MNNNHTKRLVYIDVIAGIMIIWMIFGHCRHFSSTKLPFPNFLGFFMPWFFYKSGYFFKTLNQNQLLRKDTGKLLRYLFVYALIGWVVWSLCGLADHSLRPKDCIVQPIFTFLSTSVIKPNGSSWFLFTLFFVRQAGNVVIKNDEKNILILTAAFICFAGAYLLNTIEWYNKSWWFGNFFSGLCFFLLGYWFKDKEQKKTTLFLSTLFYFGVIGAFYIGKIGFPVLYMHANKMFSGNYILFYPFALAEIVMINNIFHYLCKHIKFNILEYVGQNAMYYYVTHWILLILIAFIAKVVFHIERPLYLLIMLSVTCLIFLPFIICFIKS